VEAHHNRGSTYGQSGQSGSQGRMSKLWPSLTSTSSSIRATPGLHQARCWPITI
jgi:hypothetical protein